jgi:hypothetical protein
MIRRVFLLLSVALVLSGLTALLGCNKSEEEKNLPHDSSLTFKKPQEATGEMPNAGKKGGLKPPAP